MLLARLYTTAATQHSTTVSTAPTHHILSNLTIWLYAVIKIQLPWSAVRVNSPVTFLTTAASGLDIRWVIKVHNDVATHSMLIYRTILCSLQLAVGTSAGADSKGQTSLGTYTNNIYSVTKDLYTPMYTDLDIACSNQSQLQPHVNTFLHR